MLLGAFIIGFAIAWLLRNLQIREMNEAGFLLEKKVAKLTEVNDNMEVKRMNLEEELDRCIKSKEELTSKEDLEKALSDLRAEREKSMTARSSLMEIESAHEGLKKELEVKIAQMIPQEEATRLRAEANRLKVFNASLQEEIAQLKAQGRPVIDRVTPESMEPEISQSPPIHEMLPQISTDYSFLESAGIMSAGEAKDDLKRINGVGPFIEKKLNGLGIFTFEQVASLNEEQVNKVTAAIEFFPGRIMRDDWVGQARRLM